VLTVILGAFGALLVYFFSPKISYLVFNTFEYASQISLLGIAVLFANLTGGYLATIQGTGGTKNLAIFNVLSGMFNLIISVILFVNFGSRGIIPSIVSIAIVEFGLAIFLARKIYFKKITFSIYSFFKRTKVMIVLGFSFMVTSLGSSLLALAINSLITKNISIEAVGIYAAATALTVIFINFVLSAMSADFYPRLTSLIESDDKARNLINKQTEIGICLVLPGLFATAALSDLLVPIFYSDDFIQASSLIPIMVMGCLPRIISWPLGYIMIVKAASRLIILSEILLSIANFFFVFMFIENIGLWAPVIGVLIVRLSHILITYIAGMHLIDFKWSKRLLRIIFVLLLFLSIHIILLYILSGAFKIIFGISSSALIAVICIKNITSIIELPPKYKIFLEKIKLI